MRLISLGPSFTEILESLQAGSDLVGVTDDCLPSAAPHPSATMLGGSATTSGGNPLPVPGRGDGSNFLLPQGEGRVRVGSPKALDLPKIDSLAPDVILSDPNENRPEEIRELAKKFKVLSFDVRSLTAVIDTVWAIARLVGRMEQAETFKRAIQKEHEETRHAMEGRTPTRALLLLWDQPYITVNFDTYASRLMEACGAVNVFHEDPLREFPVELEDMIDKNPELLLLAQDPFPFKKRHVARFRQYRIFSKIPIQLIDGNLISRYGPRTVEAMRALRKLGKSEEVRNHDF